MVTGEVQRQNRFRRSGDYWIVSYEGRTVHLRDTSGLRYIVALLRQPGIAVPATQLLRPERSGGGANGDSDAARNTELVRVNVTRAIRYALRKLAQYHPALADHFQIAIRTGGKCGYLPDPRVATEWEL